MSGWLPASCPQDDELSGEKWDNAFQRLRAVCAVPCCCAWLALYVERRIQVRQKKPPPTPRFARLLLSKWKHACASCGAHCCDCKWKPHTMLTMLGWDRMYDAWPRRHGRTPSLSFCSLHAWTVAALGYTTASCHASTVSPAASTLLHLCAG